MKVFVTSNQQFGRPGAIKAYKRSFYDVHEMNESLVESWNSVVSDDDTVYVLGNFAWDPETAELMLSRLNGTIFNITGEYDKAIIELDENSLGRLDIGLLYNVIEEIPTYNAVISYWPLLDWPSKTKGSYSIIGHPNKKYKSDHKSRIINCTCDLWNFKPVEISKIIELFDEAKALTKI